MLTFPRGRTLCPRRLRFLIDGLHVGTCPVPKPDPLSLMPSMSFGLRTIWAGRRRLRQKRSFVGNEEMFGWQVKGRAGDQPVPAGSPNGELRPPREGTRRNVDRSSSRVRQDVVRSGGWSMVGQVVILAAVVCVPPLRSDFSVPPLDGLWALSADLDRLSVDGGPWYEAGVHEVRKRGLSYQATMSEKRMPYGPH